MTAGERLTMPIGGSDETRAVLRQFLEDWREALNTPDARRIERSIANAAVALDDALTYWVPGRLTSNRAPTIHDSLSFHGYLAHELRDLLAATDPSTVLIEAMAPSEVSALRTGLAAAPIDARALQPALARLCAMLEVPGVPVASHLAKTVSELRAPLRNLGSFKSGALQAVARLHTRALLRDHLPRDLETWAE